MTKRKTKYNIVVDKGNTKAAFDEIQQKLENDIKTDFNNGLLPDGVVPRGLIASLARKYGYTNTWIVKLLKRQGIQFERKVVMV